MWEPVGPLPASVYWRRRWVALVSSVSVLVVLGWSVAAAFRWPDDESTAVRPASHAASSAPRQASSPPAAPPSLPGVAGVADPGSPPLPPSLEPPFPEPPFLELMTPAGVLASPEVPVAASEQLLPDETPRRSAPAPTHVQVPPTGPVPCTNAMLGVGAEIERPEHRVGDRPVLRLVVTNISDQPCVRDLDAARQEIVVWSGDGVRLWSSNDCSTASGVDLGRWCLVSRWRSRCAGVAVRRRPAALRTGSSCLPGPTA